MKIKDGDGAIVTGGASGIGLAIAHELARQGCQLILVDCDESRLVEAVSTLHDEGFAAEMRVCDVTKAEQVEQLALETSQTFPQLAILVNSAGISLAGGFLESASADFERVMDVNFGGVVNMTRAFLPHLARQPQAHIVNIGSAFGLMGLPNKTAYCASKFAVRGFTEALQCELAATQIGVTLLLPGPIATRLLVDGKAASPTQRQAEIAFVRRRALCAERVARRTPFAAANGGSSLASITTLLIGSRVYLQPLL